MKKKKIVLFVFLIIGVLSLFLTYKFKQNNLSKNKPVKEEKLSIMIKESGATEYTKSSSKDIPKGNYTLNTEKSYCKNNGKIEGYDSTTGTVSFAFIGTDRCFLYFDYIMPKLYDTIAKRYSNNDTYVKLYNGADYGDTTNYANNIYYFNGAVENNNVLFGGFCWKIVRTTETGGVKMIYNGKQYNTVEDYTLLSQSEYVNLSNDATYPYSYDETNKTWTSTNTGTNSSTISFTAPSNGDYVINYDLSMYDSLYNMDVEIFKDDVSQGKFTGTKTGQIVFKDLTTSNVIKVVYTRTVSWTSGSRNNVIFSFGRANSIIKSCNNTEADAGIGVSMFNIKDNSLAYVGYMYNKNKIYTASSKTILSKVSLYGKTIAYADAVTYDSTTSKYTLDSTTATTLNVTSSNISSLVGKYTCSSSSTTETCTNVYYIVGYVGSSIYYYSLSNGDVDGTDNGGNYVFGNSFMYANGTYTLSDTITINTDTLSTSSTNLNTHHYTCLTNGNSCTSIYYAYYYDDGTLYYITLTNGKSVDDALNEMLYNEDVNTDDSTIKAYIDTWYKKNLKDKYADKLEDTIFCNDRTITDMGSWDPNGSDRYTLCFKNEDYYCNNTNYSLACDNKNDRFTVSSSNGNGALTYPVGLLTAPEVWLAYKDANYNTYYLKSGDTYLLASPEISFRGYAYNKYVEYDGGINHGNFFSVAGGGYVRPVISLKSVTQISSGDGKYTNPFVVQ